MSKYVYFFGGGKADGNRDMKDVLGGKGANLAEMTNIGLPVPPGFTISAGVCRYYYQHGKKYPPELAKQVGRAVSRLEKEMGKRFGDARDPLLVSVRSGAAVSMPGMMDTVLNLGLNEKTLPGLIKKTGNPRFGWDTYRRFIQMFGNVVMGVPHHAFEHQLEEIKRLVGKRNGVKGAARLEQEALNRAVPDTALEEEDLKKLVQRYKKVYRKHTGEDFPSDPLDQLWKGIGAVFGSWNIPRAVKYRQIHSIKGLLGTAVNVQAMVFGNMGDDSGTGVAFTRDPSTGKNRFYGEYLLNAQGEDVVAGIRTPRPISELRRDMPGVYRELISIRKKLERHYRDTQDLEFTIEKGRLFILQTRTGKRTAQAAVKIAADMVKEKLISRRTAVLRVEPGQIDQILHPMLDPAEEKKQKPIATGLPASPGAAVGKVVFSAEEAEDWHAKGEKVVLVRVETSPEDIGGMNVARGILTARGGMTSHAAVVARGMGKPCVAGAGGIAINYRKKEFKSGEVTVKEGDWISLEGSRGYVYRGQIPTVEPKLSGPFGTLMKWADSFRTIGVRANADTPRDAAAAVKFGAEGIGLCRTEHMFFEGERIWSFRKMILVAEKVKDLRARIEDSTGDEKKKLEKMLSAPLKQYRRALAELLPLQRKDFEGIFRALRGRPCTIRLLDPPLHEFLPQDSKGQKEMARRMGVTGEEIRATIAALHEFNPMLGHRGCRLGLTYPEVSEMQVRAIIEAALNVRRKAGISVRPEIMIPLVGHVRELEIARNDAEEVIKNIFKKKKVKKNEIPYLIGTMIEIPRAAVTADEIARVAQFFSFGTNDLTQMGCGFSRDDAGSFLGDYVKLGVYENDPFQVLDQAGIGKLVRMAIDLGRRVKPDLKIGICGEHGGEPASVEFCYRVGMDYVSCSPFRVPIARLAAAQAAVREKQK